MPVLNTVSIRKNIIKIFLKFLPTLFVGIDGDLILLDRIEAAEIIDPMNMIRVGVGVEHRVDPVDSVP